MAEEPDNDKQPQPETPQDQAPPETKAGGGDAAPPPPPPPRPHLTEIDIPRGWLWGLVAAVVFLLLAATAFFAGTNDNRTCGWCHVIKNEVSTFNTSEHHKQGVQCQSCHTKPGVFNYFVRNLASVTHIIENISGHYERPVTTFVGAENCVQCHKKDQIEQDLVVGNIRVNHKGLREAGYQCITCHAEIAHGAALPTGAQPQGSIMSVCWQCHNGVDQPQRCSICHLNGVPPGSVQVTMPLHMRTGDCTQCHKSATFCAKCHNGLAMPHPAGWRKAHGPLVLDRGARICASCHTKQDPKFCLRCHGLPMPHPATWLSAHGAPGLAKPVLCAKCHGPDSCIRCHGLQMPHPGGWLSTHPATAESNPSLCSKCHSTSFCQNCHGVALPHPSSFIASHWDFAVRQGNVCVKCHGNSDGGSASCFGGDCHARGTLN